MARVRIFLDVEVNSLNSFKKVNPPFVRWIYCYSNTTFLNSNTTHKYLIINKILLSGCIN